MMAIRFPHRAALLIALLSPALSMSADDPKPKAEREKVGEVLGKPVYRDQLDAPKGGESDRVVALFGRPLFDKYQKDHQKELEPTKDEIRQVTAYFDAKHREEMKTKEPELREELKEIDKQLEAPGLEKKKRGSLKSKKDVIEIQLAPPGEGFSIFLLTNWKLQRHLYDHHGGGRILWQQAGLEAFDATRVWLESCEKSGDLKISDPKVRAAFFHYWTRNHGSFLLADKEAIREEFLEPAWAPKPAKP